MEGRRPDPPRAVAVLGHHLPTDSTLAVSSVLSRPARLEVSPHSLTALPNTRNNRRFIVHTILLHTITLLFHCCYHLGNSVCSTLNLWRYSLILGPLVTCWALNLTPNILLKSPTLNSSVRLLFSLQSQC